jgi:O-methyltransferase involved in polyketide biosynthesis
MPCHEPSPTSTVTAGLRSLEAIERDFPQFVIWREALRDRIRYIARARDLSTPLHTVVAADLGELRAALADATPSSCPAAGEDPPAPNVARMYDFWRGGKDNLAPDRQAAATIARDFPEVAAIAKANRHFVTRAVAHVAAQGITQFVDLGAGLPAWPAVHQAAREHQPHAAVAYLDHDPLVLAHARAWYAAPGVSVIPGDPHYPKAILADPDLRAAIDFTQPACLILAAVLHFLRPAEADHTVRVLTAALAPGSYLVISAGTCTGTDPALLARLRAAYAHTSPISARTQEDTAAWFAGFMLIRPYDAHQRRIAANLNRTHPNWHVMWGARSRQLWAFPLFDASPGIIISAASSAR